MADLSFAPSDRDAVYRAIHTRRDVRAYLPEHDTSGLQIEIMAPVDAIRFTLDRIRKGQDTISVTGPPQPRAGPVTL